MKKLLALIMAAVMSFSLAACGSPPKGGANASTGGSVDNGNNDGGSDGSGNPPAGGVITDMSQVNVDGVILEPVPINPSRAYMVMGYAGDATSVVIPDSYNGFPVSLIWTMSENTEIEYVTIPSSVKEILPSAFKGCSGIKEIHIPSSVTVIGGGRSADALRCRRSPFRSSAAALHSRITNTPIPSDIFSEGRLTTAASKRLSSLLRRPRSIRDTSTANLQEKAKSIIFRKA